tara:strand:- start:660 stop:896 length:237 start_codon:yes stop_codon:yes gene_type:complete
MKTMTCKQLGGACHFKIQAENFNDMAALSRKLALEMIQKGDQAHQEAMHKMKELVQSSHAMDQWIKEKEKIFNTLLED